MSDKLNILVVDDDRRMAHTLSDILTMSGHKAEVATSGDKALELIGREQFDCVIADIKMPGMNGVELHREISQRKPGLPVILMTAYASDNLIRQGLEQGVVATMEKPLDISQLLDFFASISKSRTIAIVDDDPSFCHTLGEILHTRGFRVSKILEPDLQADQFVGEAQVILLDMKLGQLNGLEILKEIRSFNPDLPVLLITGYKEEMASSIESALKIKATACLYKPLIIQDLLNILSTIHRDSLRKTFYSE